MNECTKLELSRKELMEKVRALEGDLQKQNKVEEPKQVLKKVNGKDITNYVPTIPDVESQRKIDNNINIEQIIDDRMKAFEERLDQVKKECRLGQEVC